MQMYYKSCVHSRTIKVHELLCCINGYAMRIEGKKFEFEDTIVWVFVMHSSVEWLQKGCICKLAPTKRRAFFSLMYFCESLCINRISHNYVIPQFLFCIIMPFRTSFHIPFRKLFSPFTLTGPMIQLIWGGIMRLRGTNVNKQNVRNFTFGPHGRKWYVVYIFLNESSMQSLS